MTEWKPDFRRARGRPKSRWKGHKKEKNPQLEGEDPRSEVTKRIRGEAKTSKALE